MSNPSELMSNSYKGPSKVIPLGQIKNEDGFRFIGIDKSGEKHWCIVREGDDGNYYMSSNTITFQELTGWLPDAEVSK